MKTFICCQKEYAGLIEEMRLPQTTLPRKAAICRRMAELLREGGRPAVADYYERAAIALLGSPIVAP